LTHALQVAEKTAGDTLADGDAEKEISAVGGLRAKLSVIELAISSLRSRRPAAISAQLSQQAGAVRTEAADKRKQLANIEIKTGKCLAELSRIEGVNYSNTILLMESNGAEFFQPKSEILRAEINHLDAKASRMEAQSVSDRGGIDIEDVTDDRAAVMTVLTHPSDGPTAETVYAFLANCARSSLRVPDRSFGNRPRRVCLQWGNGIIDTGVSYVFVSALAVTTPGSGWGAINRHNPSHSEPAPISAQYDVESATFRASAV
jgi:hypothetical protein